MDINEFEVFFEVISLWDRGMFACFIHVISVWHFTKSFYDVIMKREFTENSRVFLSLVSNWLGN